MLRLLAVLCLLALAAGCRRSGDAAKPSLPEPHLAEAPVPPPSPDVFSLRAPTGQERLGDTNVAGVLQPTASGNPESGGFGSVRTGQNGLPRFHEGLDIAALARDRKGRPLDDVSAAMHGTVGLLHTIAGNSDYGLHVVLVHNDPAGPFYSLYAHLASIDAALRPGMAVTAGTRLGRMGNSALSGIPMERAHLHLEFGLLASSRFETWPGRKPGQTPGGVFNGQNLLGFDPAALYRFRALRPDATLRDHLQANPAAFTLAIRPRRQLDYFEHHPALWQDPPYEGRTMVLTLSESGLPLSGRNATADEEAALKTGPATVLAVNEQHLGRNGRRHIVRKQGRWVLGENGERWLSILTHPAGLRENTP